MASQDFYFEGMFKWARVHTPQTFSNGDKVYGLSFYPKDDATRRALKATGIRNEIKEDDDGFFVQLRRKAEDGAPMVTDPEGNKIDKLVGNGSRGKVKLNVEEFVSTKYGKVVRSTLVGVIVSELVEYNPEPKAEAPAEKPADVPF